MTEQADVRQNAKSEVMRLTTDGNIHVWPQSCGQTIVIHLPVASINQIEVVDVVGRLIGVYCGANNSFEKAE